MSMEGEEGRDDLQEDDIGDDDEEFEDRRPAGLDDFEDMEEDPNRYQPLKRRASTGTLLSQARASAVSIQCSHERAFFFFPSFH